MSPLNLETREYRIPDSTQYKNEAKTGSELSDYAYGRLRQTMRKVIYTYMVCPTWFTEEKPPKPPIMTLDTQIS